MLLQGRGGGLHNKVRSFAKLSALSSLRDATDLKSEKMTVLGEYIDWLVLGSNAPTRGDDVSTHCRSVAVTVQSYSMVNGRGQLHSFTIPAILQCYLPL